MKYISVNYKLSICKRITLLVVLLFYLLSVEGQTAIFKNGVQQGVVKVKFDPSMTTTLSQMQIRTRGTTFSTGISTLDKAVGTLRATHMERLIPESSNPQLEAKHRKAGLHLWYIIEFDTNVDVNTAIQTLKSVQGVKKVEREHFKTVGPHQIKPYTPTKSAYSALPYNDPLLKDQWHYINSGQLGLPGDKFDANLAAAWAVTAGRSDIIVSIHDEGIDVNHEDLKANLWVNTKEIPGNGIDDDGNGYIDDVHGFNFTKLTGNIDANSHGTHVAGTVAAVNNNGIGVSGVAGGTGNGDGVKVMSTQILGEGSTGGNIFRSYVYAADMGAVISQNSWGYQSAGVYEQDVLDGIDYFINNAGDYPGSPMKGGIVIFASGNDNKDDLFYPGIYDKCLAVSAIGPEGKKASYSNFGKWVEISAPGGDMNTYGIAKTGVLSTVPGNQYGYMNGTSMACPHVSGIAALALASSDKQLTNTELWQRLITSIKDIDGYNPEYIGQMGTGTIDAYLAVKNNGGTAPEKITNLTVKGIAQEFATLEWSVPSDTDDGTPISFEIYYSTESITKDNLDKATKIDLKNSEAAGSLITLDIENLLGTTTYYFGIISVDRWGNKSELSNIASAKTNDGPSIDVNTGSENKTLTLSATVPNAITNGTFQILNNSEGILRWQYTIGNSGHTYSATAFSARTYPQVTSSPKGIGMENAKDSIQKVRNTDIVTQSGFTSIEKKYVDYTTVYIGDTDPSIPTSGAVKFIVNEEDGFNLTQVKTEVKYTTGTGPLIVEVYKDELNKNNLLARQEYQPANSWTRMHNIPLKEHIYFEKGKEFYIVVHVPGGNGYSLGIGNELSSEYSNYCYYSPDYGATWKLLSTVGVSQVYAWDIRAVSQLPHISEFLSLDSDSGTISGNSSETISATADGTTLINGTYNANVIFKSNDSKNNEFRMPVVFNISGHKPEMVYPHIVNFGSIFKNQEATLDIILENIGYGLVNNLNATVDNPQFEIETQPSVIAARSEAAVRVTFKPTALGNINGKLTITNGQYTYLISLFGVGAETSEIQITPDVQTVSNITIGDEVESTVSIKNNGGFPLKYFIPGFDTQGISNDWPTSYHKYGYVVRSNVNGIGVDASLPYNFEDISATGTDITSHYIDNHYKEVAFGFDFPYYGTIQEKIFITKNGFTSFEDNAYPYNVPKLKGDLKGYLSIMGYSSATNLSGAKVHYKAESNRLIIQYTDVKITNTKFTAQMQLFANGNIRFYYQDIPLTGHESEDLTVLIEDVAQTDGILVRNKESDFTISNGTVIGFDYPGPDIITNIENGSGVVAPNETATVKVKMATSSLYEGDITRNVNIVSNDPIHPNSSFSTILNITSGGSEDYAISTEEVDFGVVYQNYPYTKELAIRNKGTKAITITSLSFDNTKFNVSGNMTIQPGINEIFNVSPVTNNIAELEDILTINFSNGSTETLNLKASVRTVPVAVVDVTPISANLELNEQKTFPYSVENTGGSDLEVSFIGGQWFRFEETSATTISKYNYHVKEENSGEPSYNWLDITKTGTKVPYDMDGGSDKTKFWTEVELPFTFKYYGTDYNKIKVGYNGIIALGGDPDAKQLPQRLLPIGDTEAAFIYPMWSAGGFDLYHYPNDAGIYYQQYDDKIVISWMYFINFFGWGESFQAILHKDGLIKFQYKRIDGVSDGTGSGIVGIESSTGNQFISISNQSALPHKQGLAYLIVPDNAHVVASNDKIEGNIVFESTNIYGGNFSDNLLIKTNDPATPEFPKPLSVSVAGTAEIDAVTAIDLGDLEVAFDDETYTYQSVIKPLVIKNTGTAPFRITNARMETGGKYLTQLVLASSWSGPAWLPIENLFTGYPEQLLLPGASFNSYVRFAPEVAGSYEDVLILDSSLGDIRINLKGFGYDSPTINIDNSPIEVSFNTPNETTNKTIAFDNVGGGYKLDYNISVNYKRGLESTSNTEKTGNIANALGTASANALAADTVSTSKVVPYSDSFNRKLQYVDSDKINNAIGNSGMMAVITATKFIADKTGFTLSDVGSYVQLDKGVSGTINVEVRVGGTNITNARTIATKDIEFTYPEDVTEKQIIKQINVTFDEAVQILPNEEFYVIFTYPLDLTYPQTIKIGNEEVSPGRFWWFTDGAWYDFQEFLYLIGADNASGIIMYAAERSFTESGWIKILTSDTGTLQIDEKTTTEIQLAGSFAETGDQKANLIIKTNAVNASVVEVPVSLHMNEAPVFVEAPVSAIAIENEVSEVTIPVMDKENHNFTVEVTEKPEFVTSTINEDKSIKLSIAAAYGHAGNYSIKMKATDEHAAMNEHAIDLQVTKTNRAPQFTGSITELKYNIGANTERMSINKLFTDPDGDKLTFTVTSLDKNIIDVYQSDSEFFIVEPKSEGSTKLKFVVSDGNNATITHEIIATVNSCLATEGIIIQKWNYVLLVNNVDGDFKAYQWYKNGAPVIGANKQYYSESGDAELDFDATYYVQLTTANGQTVFTCPFSPVKKDISLKAYPNPVKQGESVNIEAQLPDLENNPLTIQIINLNGQTVNTVSSKEAETSVMMDYRPGAYLIRVANSNIERTFNVIVE